MSGMDKTEEQLEAEARKAILAAIPSAISVPTQLLNLAQAYDLLRDRKSKPAASPVFAKVGEAGGASRDW
jgi:hypothetical protein